MTEDRLTRDRLTRDVWLHQRAKGHRFSSDDVVTALIAARAVPDAARILDLGCGIGSVLLHLAWTHPHATLVGIEAQDISFALLERNVADNGFGARVTILHGDLREVAPPDPPFALVTGTPPYFPPGAAVDALDPQRAYARIEYRGGVEAYVAAAARVLAPDGTFVVCGDARADARVHAAAAEHALAVIARCEAIPRVGTPALFAVWTLRRAPYAVAEPASTTLTIRDADGRPTADAAMLKAFSGLA